MKLSRFTILNFGEYLELPSIQSVFDLSWIDCLNVRKQFWVIFGKYAKYAKQQTSLLISYSVGGENG